MLMGVLARGSERYASDARGERGEGKEACQIVPTGTVGGAQDTGSETLKQEDG